MLATLVVIGCLESSASADPDNTARNEARVRFSRGVELFSEGDAAGALAEFLKAYSIQPHFQVLYNIAKVHDQLNDYASALDAFERYLNDGGNALSLGRRDEVVKEIERLQRRVATLQIVTEPAGATLSVDDTPQTARTPTTVRVSAGRRRVTVSREGYFPSTVNIDIAGQETRKIQISLVEREARPAPPPAVSSAPIVLPPPVPVASVVVKDPPPKSPGISTGATVSWVLTGAMFTGAVVTGALALGAKAERDDQRNTLGASPSDIRSSNDRARTLAITSDALSATTVILGGLSVYLTLRPTRESSSALVLTPGHISWASQF